MRTASRVTSGPIPSPAPTSTFNCIDDFLLRRRKLRQRFQICGAERSQRFSPAVVRREQRDQVLVEDGLSVIGQLVEAVVDGIEIGGISA